jgi:acyl dehydratase
VPPESDAPLRIAITHGTQRMVMWTAANRDYALIHVDREYARAAGAPDVFANTFFVEALYERLLRGHVGAAGAIERIAFRMHRFLAPARRVEVLGWPDGDRVRLQQVADGVVTSSGEALVR